MSVKLSGLLKDAQQNADVADTLSKYENGFEKSKFGKIGGDDETSEFKDVNNHYYDLVTDFYEFGWGRSFHFAPRVPGESFAASLARHEHYIAHMLGLGPGMVAADLGSGVGGPMVEIARFSGARIVGINSNEYQIERARKLSEGAGLSHLTNFLHCDFHNVDAPDDSFDAAFSIEATCCSSDKARIYSEVYRLLKPGACFAGYEYCLTDRYDASDPYHVKIKSDIELGGGLPDIAYSHEIDEILRSVGFEVLETRDLAEQSGPSVPWYLPLAGSGLSFASFRSSSVGRLVTQSSLRVLETLRIVPRGTVRVSKTLNLGADAMVESGRLGIFSPMYFVHVRKPL